MIKDVVVNLSGRGQQHFAADYAVSLGTTFSAHVVGVAFIYDAIIPDGSFGGVPVELIEMQREENMKAATAAIDVVIVASDRPKSDEIPGADIGHHLARHGLNVDVKRIVATDTDVANTLLSHAADTAADFIVMGGYGHSRLREFILGGVTRGILASLTVPALMSH